MYRAHTKMKSYQFSMFIALVPRSIRVYDSTAMADPPLSAKLFINLQLNYAQHAAYEIQHTHTHTHTHKQSKTKAKSKVLSCHQAVTPTQ